MKWKYKLREGDNISGIKKYCIALDHRQHSLTAIMKSNKNQANKKDNSQPQQIMLYNNRLFLTFKTIKS